MKENTLSLFPRIIEREIGMTEYQENHSFQDHQFDDRLDRLKSARKAEGLTKLVSNSWASDKELRKLRMKLREIVADGIINKKCH